MSLRDVATVAVPALKGLTIGQRILGVVLALAIWLAPAGATWLYMKGQAKAQFELGQADARTQCAERNASALAKAIKDAREEWERTQGAIDKKAAKDAAAIAKFLADARRDAGQLSEEIETYVAAHPLPAGCRLDGGRVELFNRARRGRAPEG